MKFITVFFIAVGLAMDAFSVSIASGVIIHKVAFKNAFKIALFFGIFQAFMPVVGWLTGLGLKGFISQIDHWIAFLLLSLVGIKMIYDSIRSETKKNFDPLNIYVLLMLSIATSIDALVAGITLSMVDISIVTPVLIIGVITFLFSFAGVYIGGKLGHFFEKKIEMFGGIILVMIGVYILLEHLLG